MDELDRYRPAIEAVTAADVQRVAREHIRPDELAIVLVGDADAILPGLEGAGLGPIEVIRDPEPVQAAAGDADELAGPVDSGEGGPAEGAEDPDLPGSDEPADPGTDDESGAGQPGRDPAASAEPAARRAGETSLTVTASDRLSGASSARTPPPTLGIAWTPGRPVRCPA